MIKLTKIIGWHAVQSVLDYSPEKITRAWIDQNRQDLRLATLLDALKNRGIEADYVERKKLDKLANQSHHQGVILEIQLPSERNEDDLKQLVDSLNSPALFLILDQVQDPHNLGACLRTADACAVHGIIITKDNAVGLTATVCKVASGAAETIPVFVVTNLARTLRWLKSENIWLIGTAHQATQTFYECDLTTSLALIIGAEDKGMRQLTRQQCDLLVSIPMQGSVSSLNLSVACGVLLYEAMRQRHHLNAI